MNNTNQTNKITTSKERNIIMKNGNTTPKYLRPKELAEYLGIGLSTVWLYSKQGKIKRIKMSQKVTLFNVEETEKALNLNESMN